MSFNFNRLSNEATNMFSRAKQFTEEKLGSASKTDYDVNYETANVVYEKIKKSAEKLKNQTEITLKPNPNVRVEDFVYSKLDKPLRERASNFETLGAVMIDAGHDLGPTTPYGEVLTRCGQTEILLGEAEHIFFEEAVNGFLNPLNNFLERDCKGIQKEQKALERKRLDLDVCKSRVKKAKTLEIRKEVEIELNTLQTEFDRQQDATKLQLEEVCNNDNHYTRNLINFIEAQTNYYAACHQHMKLLSDQIKSNKSSSRQESSKVLDPQKNTSPKRCRVKVLYDYDATSPSELSLVADEVIFVDEDPSKCEKWVMGNNGKKRGKVPVNYIALFN